MNAIKMARPILKTGTNVYLDTNNGYPSIQTNTYPKPIWVCKNKRTVIEHFKLLDLLNKRGYGTLNGQLIRRSDENVLSLKDTTELWEELYEFFMEFDESDYEDESKLGVLNNENKFITKSEVRNAFVNYGVFKNTLYLNKYSEDSDILNNPKKRHLHTPLFRDNKDEVYTFFNNGVVKTTRNGSILKGFQTLNDGYIWDTKIRKELNEIDLSDKTKGLFEEFVEKCMSVKNDNGEWTIDETEYESFRTVYGYLLSNYTNNGETPSPVFVDRESDGVHAEGGNGKSLVMKSVKHWKMTTPINGRNIQKDNRFTFSGIKDNTEFVFLDDVNVNFPFEIIYNYTTGDMEIERKGIDRKVIPEDIKPKIGVCTNYIMSDTSHSTARRQYVVEFGRFWNEQSKKGISVEKYLGKRLIDRDFTESDWNRFYNFGFRCIQEFLEKGVVQTDKSNYLRKQLISKIEGHGVNDGVVEWIEKYIRTTPEIKTGVTYDKMFGDFIREIDEEVHLKWSTTKFKKSVFEICQHNKWDYNPDRSGTTLSEKRWKTGKKGNQKDSLRVII